MIRWQQRKEGIELGRNVTAAQITTTTTRTIIPGYKVEQKRGMLHTERDGAAKTEFGVFTTTTIFGQSTPENTQRSVSQDNPPHDIPVLALPNAIRPNFNQPGALREGALTGLTNATTGALVGSALAFLLCPPAALAWSVYGALTTGILTGLAQAVSVKCSNDCRQFFEDLNGFLTGMRNHGPTAYNDRIYQQLLRTYHNDALFEPTIKHARSLCVATFGEEACRGLRYEPANQPDPRNGPFSHANQTASHFSGGGSAAAFGRG